MEHMLGRFGDRRLEKGGPSFWTVLLRSAKTAFGSGHLAATERARFVLGGSCIIHA